MKRSRFLRSEISAVLLLVLSMAPAAGNIGSCGQEAEPLDAYKFLTQKAAIDCSACVDCVVYTEACLAACSAPVDPESAFPDDCLPLVHDGEVCLDALHVASCDEYAAFMADVGATIPNECNFCPLDENGEPVREEE